MFLSVFGDGSKDAQLSYEDDLRRTMFTSIDKAKRIGKRKCIGMLDIYGFEVLEFNSFEQLIINYCNEKLQQILIELTLKAEQEEYIREGIQWEHIDYFNNAVICDLIEKNHHGILALLDEECLRPGPVSDETFLYKLTQACQDNPYFESRGCRNFIADSTLPHHSFRVRHYAGAGQRWGLHLCWGPTFTQRPRASRSLKTSLATTADKQEIE
ncbi:unconventional myosin-Ib [Trichonephila clavipes]|uniref:Unconventional myosin-Ib n=1 Tax=Trichonephila clavipes TaxID=2585209 RepID=A0A8X6VN26_TRICX|nr:unconventional myosin-Ib [Trichonephila clavipes]